MSRAFPKASGTTASATSGERDTGDQKPSVTALRTKFIDFDARRDPKTDFYCVRCQKDMDRSQPCRAVHMINGGYYALHAADEAKYVPDGGEMGCWPIGDDCATKLGLEWTHEKALWPQRALS